MRAAGGAALLGTALRATAASPVALSVVLFGAASAAMTLGNKFALEQLRDPVTRSGLPSSLVAVQVLGTLALLCGPFRSRVDFDRLNAGTVRRWLPIVTLFAGMLYSSARTFVYVHVSFVLVVRNLCIVATTILEHIVRGTRITTRMLLAEASIITGVAIYGYSGHQYLKDFWAGMFWCGMNILCQASYGVVVKTRMEEDAEVREMSKYTMALLNNLLALPYFIAVAAGSGEASHYVDTLPHVPTMGWAAIAVTTVAGFGLSTTGFGLQKSFSASAFLVVVNMLKVVNIILGILLLGDRIRGVGSIAGCIIALGGGAWYSWETQPAQHAGKETLPPPPTPPGAGPASAPASCATARRPTDYPVDHASSRPDCERDREVPPGSTTPRASAAGNRSPPRTSSPT